MDKNGISLYNTFCENVVRVNNMKIAKIYILPIQMQKNGRDKCKLCTDSVFLIIGYTSYENIIYFKV